MLCINWPIVLVNTAVLYLLIILTLPFNQVYSTIFLFTLIAFWTRLPGVGIRQPFFPVLCAADMVDFFSMIIAINVSGFTGGIVCVYSNIMSRLAGIYPSWRFTIEDSFGMFIACLSIPYIRDAFGLSIFACMLAFTLVRAIVVLPISFALTTISYVQWFTEMIVGLTALLIINGIYAKFFGGFLNNLLTEGVNFSWILFILVTIVIIIFYGTVFGYSKAQGEMIKKTVRHVVKKGVERVLSKDTINTQRHDIDEIKKIKDNI